MNSRVYAVIGVLVGLALVACRDDPLANLDGTPSALALGVAQLDLRVNATGSVTASVLDGRATPLEESITFTSRSAATATATPDGTFQPVPPTASRATVQGRAAGTTYVIVSGGGITDSVKVVVTP